MFYDCALTWWRWCAMLMLLPFFRMCKGCKIVSLFRENRYLPVAVLCFFGASRRIWIFENFPFRAFHFSTVFSDGWSCWLRRDRVLKFHFLSALPWESHRVKVLNKKIDVLSRGTITAGKSLCFLHLIEARGVFQFTPQRVLKRIFFAVRQLEAFLVRHYLRISRHFWLCVIARREFFRARKWDEVEPETLQIQWAKWKFANPNQVKVRHAIFRCTIMSILQCAV